MPYEIRTGARNNDLIPQQRAILSTPCQPSHDLLARLVGMLKVHGHGCQSRELS